MQHTSMNFHRDLKAKAAIIRRVARVREGNLGDVKPIGDGVSEMRLDVGPGYRLYFTRRGEVVSGSRIALQRGQVIPVP